MNSFEPDLQLNRCPICLDGFEPQDDEKYDSRCGHSVHRHCLQISLRAGNFNCSICRLPLGDVQTALSQPHLQRYVKMLQQQLPISAVRQRMQADGLSSHAIEEFFTGGASSHVARACSQAQDEQLDSSPVMCTKKFEVMIKVGLDERVVKQKMGLAGFSQVGIDAFCNKYFSRL